MSLLPQLLPTHSIPVWNLEKIRKEVKGKPGIYILWDEKGSKQSEGVRASNAPPYFPVYIGKTLDLAWRIEKHMKGKSHTEPYSVYFHTVDIYDMENIKIQNKKVKSIAEKEQFNAKTLLELYEPYLIAKKITFFNKQGNHYANKTIIEDYLKNHHNINHRRVWAPGTEAENGFKKNNIPLSPVITLHKFVKSYVSSNYGSSKENKKKFLKTEIYSQITKDLENKSFFIQGCKKEGSTWKVPIETFLYYQVPKTILAKAKAMS